MNLSLREIEMFGVLITPAAGVLMFCAPQFMVVRWAVNQIVDVNRYVWRRPLFDIACFVVFYALVLLILRPRYHG